MTMIVDRSEKGSLLHDIHVIHVIASYCSSQKEWDVLQDYCNINRTNHEIWWFVQLDHMMQEFLHTRTVCLIIQHRADESRYCAPFHCM